MKLLSKLTKQYIGWSLLVMVFSGIFIYFILSIIINHQMDERLAENLQSVEKQLAQFPETTFFDPVAHVEKTETTSEKTVFSDTLIFNEGEQEYEDYRQISAVKNIGGQYYHIILRKSQIESEDFMATLAIVTLLAMLLLWLILILFTRKLAKSLWQPFFSNLEQLKRFSVTEQKMLQLDDTGIFEFDQLNVVVKDLTNQILTEFKNQKQFSEDVSHELQTPLAIISSRLENLLGNPDLNDYSENLRSIYSSVQRLSKLNKAMILLRKIENNQFESGDVTNLKTVVSEKLEEFSELLTLKELNLETQITDDMTIEISPMLAEILINNLFSNSINHTEKGGKIVVAISNKELILSNSGTEPIAEPEKLFDRFYKGNPASKSVGLGLAIVKKICESHHLEISYHFVDNQHCFEIVSK
ncbi:HAMP domain-containing sensor histidine kinase [uncultured Draconibacterium sp.]|uniref:sensor histidine kinase n=1 Tax=uncultured Draconibacterium sp. TaxID=1573823 RepID=UPI002AA82629|nr:HAMP domain-containing sensor histidine kinase [uncultured Draconibacterium sp.]